MTDNEIYGLTCRTVLDIMHLEEGGHFYDCYARMIKDNLHYKSAIFPKAEQVIRNKGDVYQLKIQKNAQNVPLSKIIRATEACTGVLAEEAIVRQMCRYGLVKIDPITGREP